MNRDLECAPAAQSQDTRRTPATNSVLVNVLSPTERRATVCQKKQRDRTCANVNGECCGAQSRGARATSNARVERRARHPPKSQPRADESFLRRKRAAMHANPRAHTLTPGWSSEKGNESCSSNSAAIGRAQTQRRAARSRMRTLGIAAVHGRHGNAIECANAHTRTRRGV